VIEPLLEAAFYERRLGYPVDLERWTVFVESVAAGVAALIPAVWWVSRRRARQQEAAASVRA
jgi:hypothetical protein